MDDKDKKVRKINDERLTDYTKRTRSGSEQVFYQGNDDRDFARYRAEGGGREHNVIMHDKPDTIRLQPPEKHFYAKLVDGEWWWFNGCGPCNGEPRSYKTYIECEKHDVCRTCGKSRKEAGTAWGGSNGWQCKTCHDVEHNAAKEDALEAFSLAEHDDSDFMFNDQVVCPHCALSYDPDDMYEDTEVTCDRCDGVYNVELDHSTSYSTEIIGEREKQP